MKDWLIEVEEVLQTIQEIESSRNTITKGFCLFPVLNDSDIKPGLETLILIPTKIHSLKDVMEMIYVARLNDQDSEGIKWKWLDPMRIGDIEETADSCCLDNILI
jgi:hypothetical protein